jgi:hypothetical protein
MLVLLAGDGKHVCGEREGCQVHYHYCYACKEFKNNIEDVASIRAA